MRWFGSLGLLALLPGCELVKLAEEFTPPALLEVETFQGAQVVEVEVLDRGKTLFQKALSLQGGGSATFSFKLREGFYTVVVRVLAYGIPYETFQGEVKLAPGAKSPVRPSRTVVNVEGAARWLLPDAPALLEAYYPPEEAFGVPVYGETLEGRVLVSREVIPEGRNSAVLSVPTGRNPLFRIVQGEVEGKAVLSQVVEDTRVVVGEPAPAP